MTLDCRDAGANRAEPLGLASAYFPGPCRLRMSNAIPYYLHIAGISAIYRVRFSRSENAPKASPFECRGDGDFSPRLVSLESSDSLSLYAAQQAGCTES